MESPDRLAVCGRTYSLWIYQDPRLFRRRARDRCGCLTLSYPQSQVRCNLAVAGQAEGAEIVEVALPSSLGDGADVVGVPEGTATGDSLHPIERQACSTRVTPGSLEGAIYSYGVCVAEGADAFIAQEDLVAKITRIGSQSPLVDAVVRAESAAALRQNLKLAPAAEGEAVRTLRQRVGLGTTAGKGASGKHLFQG
jgi:hypothetical protein